MKSASRKEFAFTARENQQEQPPSKPKSTTKKSLISTQYKENRKLSGAITAKTASLAIPTLDLKEIKKAMDNFKD